MTRPASTKLTPELARELCQRARSKAYIAGAIGSLGSKYVLELKAVNCRSGGTLAEEQVTAASKEKVLDTLGEAASKLRGELGESLATVQKFDVPLLQATTSSLEALKAFSLGRKVNIEKGHAAALPYYQRAIELDPNFAEGYQALSYDYFNLGEVGRASEYETRAFQLREHASEREKLGIAGTYYLNVTGELDKSAQTWQEYMESYPRDLLAYDNLASLCNLQGQYEKAEEIEKRMSRLAPNLGLAYQNLANDALALQRLDEARQITHEGQTQMANDFILRDALYALAFLDADSAAMAEQQQWYAGKQEYENYGLALASDTEAYAGHLGKARELTKRAVDSAIRAGQQGRRSNLAGECCSARSCFRQFRGSAPVSRRGFEAGSRKSGCRSRSRACVRHGGRYRTSRIAGPRPQQALPSGHADAVALAARNSGPIGAGQKEPGRCRDGLAS